MRPRRTLIVISVAVVLLTGICIYVSMPRIKQFFVCQSVKWPTPSASFSVLEIIPGRMNDKLCVHLYCRWDANDGVARFALNFPEGTITYPDRAKYSVGTSPIGRRDFVIHLPLQHYPHLLSQIMIPIVCNERQDMQDLGEQTLLVRYWPSKEHAIPANTIQ